MRTLQSICEGLLDADFDSDLENEVIPKPIEWLIQSFNQIKLKLGNSHEYGSCYINASDFATCHDQFEDIIFDFRLKGTNKYKITRKQYWDYYRTQADVTIVCFTGPETHKETLMGIGNFARKGAVEINTSSRGPWKASWNNQIDMVTVKDPSLWGSFTGREPEIHSTIMPGWTNNKTKQRYYAFPGHCWESIKQALLS